METDESLLNYSKNDLIKKIQSLEAHNRQLKNLLAQSKRNNHEIVRKPFDFTNCKFQHVLLKIFYLGWNYQGFATQDDSNNTIEYHLFNALIKTCLIKDRQSSNYHRCGRTDKGVSSFGQVISIDLRCINMDYCKILNRVLPNDIQCIGWCTIKSDFSARFNCNYRTYKYYFPHGNLDLNKMKLASNYLCGLHDFRNFCKMDIGNGVKEFIRKILSINIDFIDKNCDNFYSICCITIIGTAFLWHQIRCIMTILILIGQNKEEPELIKELLNIDKNPRKPDYNLASELPLNLFFCDYSDIKWNYNNETLNIILEKLRNFWTFNSIRQFMIKDMIKDLEKIPNTNPDKKCLSNFLIQGVKTKNYIPVMKRPLCDSLEEKIRRQNIKKKR